jgi:hypothetical protein
VIWDLDLRRGRGCNQLRAARVARSPLFTGWAVFTRPIIPRRPVLTRRPILARPVVAVPVTTIAPPVSASTAKPFAATPASIFTIAFALAILAGHGLLRGLAAIIILIMGRSWGRGGIIVTRLRHRDVRNGGFLIALAIVAGFARLPLSEFAFATATTATSAPAAPTPTLTGVAAFIAVFRLIIRFSSTLAICFCVASCRIGGFSFSRNGLFLIG